MDPCMGAPPVERGYRSMAQQAATKNQHPSRRYGDTARRSRNQTNFTAETRSPEKTKSTSNPLPQRSRRKKPRTRRRFSGKTECRNKSKENLRGARQGNRETGG